MDSRVPDDPGSMPESFKNFSFYCCQRYKFYKNENGKKDQLKTGTARSTIPTEPGTQIPTNHSATVAVL